MKRFKTAEDISEIVETFENAAILRADWRHAEHLTVALYYVFHHDFETALAKMRFGIFNLLESFGVDLSEEMPHHETLTVFWIRTVDNFAKSKKGHSIVEIGNDWKTARWENRAHFFGVSAQLMRRILVDFARKRPKQNNEEVRHVSLENAFVVSDERGSDLVALEEALIELAKFDERKAKIVELRFFGGLSVEETAEVLKLSQITIILEWNKAKAWLYRELNNV